MLRTQHCCSLESRTLHNSRRLVIPNPDSRLSSGFTLIELLVALVVFAALAAAAYGGLAAIARTRGALAVQQDRFAAITRSVSAFERDLRQAVARPVMGNDNKPLPALIGNPDSIEFTRLGFANPRAEPRSNLERVVYGLDSGKLRRGRYAVLDRAPNTAPATSELLDRISDVRLRYFGDDLVWHETWPAVQPLDLLVMPRAIEFRFLLSDMGEIRRVVELPSALPTSAHPSATGGDIEPPSHNTRPTQGSPSAAAR
ncbi:MAG: type II secretion system minor pseudopilin GspJ [Dokdonella sp.]